MVASKQSGRLNISINATMFQTGLTDQMSAFVFNEIQEIEISSTIVLESYSISYANLVASNSQTEIQSIQIQSSGFEAPFLLKYDDVTTS